MKKKKMIIGLAMCSLLTFGSSCNNSKDPNSGQTTRIDDEESETGMLKSYIQDMDLKGYVGTNLKNNIKYWQASAYDNNRNIITQISEANHNQGGTSLAKVLGTDYFGVDGYYDIDVISKDNEKYIGWSMKYCPGSFGDRDFRFSNDSNAIVDWSGAKQLWIHVDASEIPSSTSLRVCFEDDSFGRESYNLIAGSKVTLYDGNTSLEVTIEPNGYIPLPATFKGYIAIDLDKDHYECYWNEGGNGVIDLKTIAQFQLALKADSKMVGKSFYMNDFAIVGNVNGEELPVNIDTTDTYKVIWDIDNVTTRKNSSESSSLAWYGEFVGKLLTGISFSYKASPDEVLVTAADEIIDDLYEAQGEDGYLGVFQGQARYSIGISNWDLWNQYHCVVGLLEWYKITGNEKALEIATKTLDCIYDTFQGRSYIVSGGFETNRGIAHGYALMYQVTHDEKYLEEAERIILGDCQDGNGWYRRALAGSHFFMSSSARWEVLHMIMTLAILYQETGEEEYFTVMNTIWYDILTTDIHNDGGFTTNEGAVGDPYREGVIETCCTIAWQAFSNEFYKINPTVDIADEIERSYYNALLGSLLDDDKYCTYNTPVNGVQGTCGTYDGRRVKSQQDISFQYNSGSPDMNCCQANFARGIGQISEWSCLTDGAQLYLNYYGTSNIVTKVNGTKVSIKDKTNYPLDGSIELTIGDLSHDTKFNFNLRIPGWCKNASIEYDGKNVDLEEFIGQYYSINKTWKNGDTIKLNLGMQFTYWKGERSQSNYTSLYYGPILLTLDSYHLSESKFGTAFDRMIPLTISNFENAKISSAAAYGAWMYVDITNDFDEKIRLVDFASAGKFNGMSQPCSYYSWLNVIDSVYDEHSDDPVLRWKAPLL